MNRREMIGMGSVAALVVVVGGRIALARKAHPAPVGTFEITHSDAQWRAMLPPASYSVLRESATEKPFTSALLQEHRQGTFTCAGCANPVFSSAAKYDSHTGWPSFWSVRPGAVIERADDSLGSSRTEIVCKTCGGHLGHVFHDGPKPTGLRYCMNGVALNFVPGAA